jgi:hypothetical protein
LMAGCVALAFNWWNLFVRLADPNHHREAITSRPVSPPSFPNCAKLRNS